MIVKRGGFDAFVGNPPFMGGQKITGSLGTSYRNYLVEFLANGQRGSADLCSYFLLKAMMLNSPSGMAAFITTNTIAQGDTREVGLDQLRAQQITIPRAIASQPWPGVASLEVSLVWLSRRSWHGPFLLNHAETPGITPYLTSTSSVSGNPYRLKANEGKSFQGSIVLGMGFVLSPDEAHTLIAKDPRNKDVLFPYLNGEDLNSRPDQSPSRWVINFFDWPEEKARTYPDVFRIVEEKVKPERMRYEPKNAWNRAVKQYWWRYGAWRVELKKAIAGMERVLVKSEVGNKLSFSIVPNEWVFSHMLIVFVTNRFADLLCLQSTLHGIWSWQYGSTMRMDLRYTPSDCFETFPFPDFTVHGSRSTLHDIGERYHAHRQQIMLARQEGLTKTYNRFHNPDESSADIQKLRDLHVEMDQAVAAAYGWPIIVDGKVRHPDPSVHAPRSTPHAPLDLGHGFHETKQGVRFTISEAARREVLQRLLKLNHERYAEEVKQGLHEKKGRGTRGEGRGKKKADKQAGPSLFQNEEDDA